MGIYLSDKDFVADLKKSGIEDPKLIDKNIGLFIYGLPKKKDATSAFVKELEEKAEVVRNYKRIFGRENLSYIPHIFQNTTAMTQIEKKFPDMKFPDKIYFQLKTYEPYFEKLTAELKKHNLGITPIESPDDPLKLQLKIVNLAEKDAYLKVGIADFNVDLYYNKSKEPSVILGNIQHNTEGYKKYKTSHKEALLNTIISCFKEAFPKKEQLIALNPKYHTGYKNSVEGAITYRLREEGIITKKEEDLLTGLLCLERTNQTEIYPSYQKDIEEIGGAKRYAELKKIFAKKVAEINAHGTGMHKSAYKKEGFELPNLSNLDTSKNKLHYMRRK